MPQNGHLLEEFESVFSVFDHFGTLCIKVLNAITNNFTFITWNKK